jgi:hypothetical protein
VVHLSVIGAGLPGLRVRVGYFFARHQISIGLTVVPAPVPAGTVWRPYPHPSGLLPAGLQVFSARCHIYARTLSTDRTRSVKQRPRLVKRPVTSVTSVRLRLIHPFT